MLKHVRNIARNALVGVVKPDYRHLSSVAVKYIIYEIYTLFYKGLAQGFIVGRIVCSEMYYQKIGRAAEFILLYGISVEGRRLVVIGKERVSPTRVKSHAAPRNDSTVGIKLLRGEKCIGFCCILLVRSVSALLVPLTLNAKISVARGKTVAKELK